MMKDAFDAMPWHDSEIIYINIDRHSPGEGYQVTIGVRWPNGEVSEPNFMNCYALDFTMNFGIIAAECVRSAFSSTDTETLNGIREKWRVLGNYLDQLKCFEIQTSSTASILRIYALNYTQQSPK